MINDIIKCPNCFEFIVIEKLNCGIFRHGVFIHSGQQVHPHLSKEDCEYLIESNQIYGCGKPFQITYVNNDYIIKKCDYI